MSALAAERVTLLIGGGTVYLYAPDDPNRLIMRDVLDVAYPAADVEQLGMSVTTWESVRAKLAGQGIEVVDCRKAPAALPTSGGGS